MTHTVKQNDSQQLTSVRGQLAECCSEERNRLTVTSTYLPGEGNKSIERCIVCGRNHYVMEVPAIPIGLLGGRA